MGLLGIIPSVHIFPWYIGMGWTDPIGGSTG